MLALALLFFVTALRLEAAEINCETKKLKEEKESCCFLNGTTVISGENVEIGGLENLNVDLILLSYNKKIEFLPLKVHKKLPNVKLFLAESANIKKISALNFVGLSKLKLLDLSGNEIENIPDDCFQGLRDLQKINLSKKTSAVISKVNNFYALSLTDFNQIKQMNGIAFVDLPQLAFVGLDRSGCVSQWFTIGSDSSTFRRQITRRCGSANNTNKQIFCSDLPLNCKGTLLKTSFFDYQNPQCCDLKSESYIDAPDFTFTKNLTYAEFEQLVIANQRLVEFLPISVHEQFPRLINYKVSNTPILKIAKKNFEKLDKLKVLVLTNNRIESIKSDTFEDLVNLERIQISMKFLEFKFFHFDELLIFQINNLGSII